MKVEPVKAGKTWMGSSGVSVVMILLAIWGLWIFGSCKKSPVPPETPPPYRVFQAPNQDIKPETAEWPRPRSQEREAERRQMVEYIRRAYDLNDAKVLEAMQNVPRHWFVPENQQPLAYADMPLPIGYDQTISQPFIVAYMTSLLGLTPEKKVLEVGTGSGYQAAVLAELTPYVYSIEIVEPLGRSAREKLKQFGYETIQVKIGDGYKGWQEHQPFDAMIVTCAPDHVPQPLLDQLKPGGCLVIPVGENSRVQNLVRIRKDQAGLISRESLLPVRFVPLVREPTP
jgi:protein-L-isoaspartate(D-aspartate) O-methyltransferase